MPRRCSVCIHPQRTDIDRALVSGIESNQAVAIRFQSQGSPSPSAVDRHRRFHLGPRLAAERALHEGGRLIRGEIERQAVTLNSLLAQVEALEAKAELIWSRSLAKGNEKTAKDVIREFSRLVELKARLSSVLRPGERDRGDVNVQVNLQQRLSSDPVASERWARLTLETIADERRDAELEASSQKVQVQAPALAPTGSPSP